MHKGCQRCTRRSQSHFNRYLAWCRRSRTGPREADRTAPRCRTAMARSRSRSRAKPSPMPSKRLRRRGRELRADAHRISSSCFPSSYCRQRMRAMVEQLAQQRAPDVSSLVEHDRSIAFPTTRNRSVEQPSRATPLTQITRYSGHLHDLGRRHVGPGSADNIKIVHSESQCGASCRACLPKYASPEPRASV